MENTLHTTATNIIHDRLLAFLVILIRNKMLRVISIDLNTLPQKDRLAILEIKTGRVGLVVTILG